MSSIVDVFARDYWLQERRFREIIMLRFRALLGVEQPRIIRLSPPVLAMDWLVSTGLRRLVGIVII